MSEKNVIELKYDCHIVVTRVIFVKATLDQGKKKSASYLELSQISVSLP